MNDLGGVGRCGQANMLAPGLGFRRAGAIWFMTLLVACLPWAALGAPLGGIAVAPANVSLAAGKQQAFTAKVNGRPAPGLTWAVEGVVGGNSIWGTVSQKGIYTAPAINPGTTVTVSATSTSIKSLTGNATVSVVNPPIPNLTGATYDAELANWEAVLMPEVQELSGLEWDDKALTWSPAPNWAPPSAGIGPQIYYLEPFLRPATSLAIAKQDIALMEELAKFHLAMLQWRTTTVAAMIQNGGANPYVFISGPSSARTFAWYTTDGNLIEVTEDEQSNAQYLSQASQLLRAIAEMPAANRTAPLLEFVQGFSGFLVSEQLLRMMYGSTPWSHYQNSNIPQPVVSAWQFLAQTGYEPPYPIKYQAAMSDTELWLVSDSADTIAADAAAPALGILNNTTRSQLKQAVLAGVSLMQARCHHTVSPDGADVLSVFAGDYDDHPSRAYSGDTGPDVPTTPNPGHGLSWDISHACRFPIIFRVLYETRNSTGAPFPALNDLVALGNTYVHLALASNSPVPLFNNFLNGWNGWLDVGNPSIADGYPPQQYCDATQSPDNCLIGGAMQGWGQLAFANPNLATLIQNLVNVAYDTSPGDQALITQHYTYDGPYAVTGSTYPWLMIYVVGDSAERLP